MSNDFATVYKQLMTKFNNQFKELYERANWLTKQVEKINNTLEQFAKSVLPPISDLRDKNAFYDREIKTISNNLAKTTERCDKLNKYDTKLANCMLDNALLSDRVLALEYKITELEKQLEEKDKLAAHEIS